MNIIDAVKSGRPFKRKGHAHYTHPLQDGVFVSKEDLLADDWELETEKKELSWYDIRIAIAKVYNCDLSNNLSLHALKEELGFKE